MSNKFVDEKRRQQLRKASEMGVKVRKLMSLGLAKPESPKSINIMKKDGTLVNRIKKKPGRPRIPEARRGITVNIPLDLIHKMAERDETYTNIVINALNDFFNSEGIKIDTSDVDTVFKGRIFHAETDLCFQAEIIVRKGELKWQTSDNQHFLSDSEEWLFKSAIIQLAERDRVIKELQATINAMKDGVE